MPQLTSDPSDAVTATGINNLDRVAGYLPVGDPAQHGFLWSNAKMTDLGVDSTGRDPATTP